MLQDLNILTAALANLLYRINLTATKSRYLRMDAFRQPVGNFLPLAKPIQWIAVTEL